MIITITYLYPSVLCHDFILSLADYLKRVMKWFVLLFYTMGAASFLTFALAAQGIIPPSTGEILLMVLIITQKLVSEPPSLRV